VCRVAGERGSTGDLVHARSQSPMADEGWFRPALVNADGSGFTVLDAYPGRKMNLVPVGWSSNEARIYLKSGPPAGPLSPP
jgi:hypothetical protein